MNNLMVTVVLADAQTVSERREPGVIPVPPPYPYPHHDHVKIEATNIALPQEEEEVMEDDNLRMNHYPGQQIGIAGSIRVAPGVPQLNDETVSDLSDCPDYESDHEKQVNIVPVRVPEEDYVVTIPDKYVYEPKPGRAVYIIFDTW